MKKLSVKRMGMFAALLLLMGSCSRNTEEQALRYHDDGRAKPIVAYIPIFEQAKFEFPWQLTDEFSTDIHTRLTKNDRLFIKNQNDFSGNHSLEDPFGKDLQWMKPSFEGSEYVVLMELVDHHITPNTPITETETKSAQTLNLTMRVRVVDLRNVKPKIILQELIQQSHHIPKFLSDIDYTKTRWGTKRFSISPIGIAHRHFTKEITTRIEDYIILSQSY